MKKLLVLFLVGFFALGCSKVAYDPFLKETTQPQAVVDSLLGEHSDFLEWNFWSTEGVRNTDSCQITTYYIWSNVKRSRIRNTTVITYSTTDTVTVKSRILDK